MQVVIAPQLEAFIEAQVKSGRYSSPDEVIGKAVQMLMEREQRFEAKLQRLRQALIAGEESGPAEEFSLETLLAELDAEAAAK